MTKSYILSEDITNDCLEGGAADLNGCNADCFRLSNAYRQVLLNNIPLDQ